MFFGFSLCVFWWVFFVWGFCLFLFVFWFFANNYIGTCAQCVIFVNDH